MEDRKLIDGYEYEKRATAAWIARMRVRVPDVDAGARWDGGWWMWLGV